MKCRLIFDVFVCLCVCCSCSSARSVQGDSTLAFPGAEGFGKHTTGGRSGKVYIITNLNDSGPGSLREAIRKKEPRIITFAISGTIELESSLDINDGNLTLAGQSAPGDGICLRNYPMKIKSGNVIIRYMRFRLGDAKAQQDDAISATGQENIIIDHCSMSWATDECASFYHNKNFTLQWSIIAESLNQSVHEKGAHGYGGIWGGEGASFHHNLLAHHTSRLPRFSGSSTTPNTPGELGDFRNNVIYNWESNNTYGGEKGRYNVVNNYYKPGPATKSKKPWMINPSPPYGKFYLSGNVLVGNEGASKNNWLGVKADHPDSARITQPFPVAMINMQTALQSCELVLLHAGASFKRDVVDARVVHDVRAGTAGYGKEKNGIIDSQRDVGGWPELKSATAQKDSDADGMPDAWEIKNNLNPTNAADASEKSKHGAYNNIEMYLNSLVNERAE